MKNNKITITLKNRTNYFNPDISRTKVHFMSPYSYMSRQIKIEGYETRLYWQFKQCEDNDGQTFFYTLTYNDKAMPNHYNMNCFDYENIRDLFTGGFYQYLRRNYGTKFKYYCGAELGDGKGKRGMHNNPHYHILFFLQPDDKPLCPYKKIQPDDFRHLVKMYWQGFDETRTGYKDYNDAKYGIAKEGDNYGLVSDFRAISYVSKYVCKDVKFQKKERNLKRLFGLWAKKEYKDQEQSYIDYFYKRIYKYYNIPRNAKHTEWTFNDAELVDRLYPGVIDFYNKNTFTIDEAPNLVHMIINRHKLGRDYCEFVNEYIDKKIKEGINEWRNRYSNKCRISKGVGDYAIPTINYLNPGIKVPDKRGFKTRPISMYYYRKIYTDTVKDKRTGNNLYILNKKGIEYKLSRLDKQIKKMSDMAMNQINNLLDNEDLFTKSKQADTNISSGLTYDMFISEYNKHKYNIQNILKKYAEYKLVYEDRFFKIQYNGDTDTYNFPDINVHMDYEYFLTPSYYTTNRNDGLLNFFLENSNKDYLPYSEHPYFLQYIRIFHLLDNYSNYTFVRSDDKKQKDAEEIARIKRFHNQELLQSFYSSFNIKPKTDKEIVEKNIEWWMKYYKEHYMLATAPGAYIENDKVCAPSYINMLYNKTK